jgi:hypothetical protein
LVAFTTFAGFATFPIAPLPFPLLSLLTAAAFEPFALLTMLLWLLGALLKALALLPPLFPLPPLAAFFVGVRAVDCCGEVGTGAAGFAWDAFFSVMGVAAAAEAPASAATGFAVVGSGGWRF